jgi:hypothetical protein
MLAKWSWKSAFLATIIGLIGVTQAIGEDLCRPALTLNEVQFSGMTAPTLERTWTAVVSVDASACAADSKGFFDIVFTRLSENAPDLEFRERYAWRPPSVEVVVNFAANEAVERYRVANITTCACRD